MTMSINQSSATFSMKRFFSCVLTSLLMGVCQYTALASTASEQPSGQMRTIHGVGEDYDPESPGNPESVTTDPKEQTYHLNIVANPTGAGSVSAGSYDLKAGEQTYLYTYNNTGFVFKNWTIEDAEVSTSTSFSYVMPEHDVTIVANYYYDPASPGNPSPLEQFVKHPAVVRAVPSAGASVNPSGTFDMEENTSRNIYAYPNTGWKLTHWTVNGVRQDVTTSPLSVTMGEKALDIAAYFVYEPSSPTNPNANYYNPTTGQVIIDDFTPGNLYDALSNLVGYNNFANVSSLIVKGEIGSNDMGMLRYLSNAETIDLSRTGGITNIPSYTFESLKVSSLILPSTVTSIDSHAFYGCENLSSLSIYAQVPPTCNAYTFSEFPNKENCTVYVSTSAIELYSSDEYWKDFIILPITDDAYTLQINLPSNGTDGRYKYNSLEIVNINSGVRQKYVISDRQLYTFNGLRKDEQYNIYMFSPNGLEIGRIENVVIPDRDIEVTFDNLKSLYTVYAKVLATDGSDVTDQVTVEWIKPLADGTTTYLRKATSLGEIPDGQQLICRVTLDNQLGVMYTAPQDIELTVTEGQTNCEITLTPFRPIVLSGTVTDSEGHALSDASISLTQILNGKYFKTTTAKTDRKGLWTANVLDAPETQVTYAADECVNVNDTIGAFDTNISTFDLGTTILKSIVGARVTYGFTYHAAGVEEVQDYYSDYQNVIVSVFNITQNRSHNDVALQYPIIAVLDENINTGDELRLTATSKTRAFNPIVEIVTIGENQRAEVTFDIIGKGGISASFDMTDNQSVAAMLYSDKGELLKKLTYTEAKVLFTDLEDGEYTLISMGHSDLMNSILRLTNFDEVGLTEGRDYVKNAVKVESGKLTEIKNDEIPIFDESLFYYTTSSTNFSTNKSSISTGNYLTLRTAIDFKGAYKNDISNVTLVVDLPEACDLIEHSIIQGPNLLPYTIDNNRLTIPLGNNYQSQTRFCVIPTKGGNFTASATVVFDYKGKAINQPIGAASSEIKDLDIIAPSIVASSTFKVTGTSMGGAEVKILEDGIVLGTGKANSAGLWNVECKLNNPYNLSIHKFYAEITTPGSPTLTSKTKSLTYDRNALQVSKVTMYHWNPEMHKTYISEFDFLNPKTSATQWTVYYPKKVFTYTVEFTDNDPERISNVILYVHTADGKFVPCNASFDKQKGLWYTEIDMGTSSNGYYPVNCSVDFEAISPVIHDRDESNIIENAIIEAKEDVMAALAEADRYDNEAIESEALAESNQEIIAEIIASFSSNESDGSDHNKIKEAYALLGIELVDENMTYVEPLEITSEFLLKQLEEADSLIADNEAENDEAFSVAANNDLEAIDAFLSEIDKSEYDTALLENYQDTEFTIDTDNGEYFYKEIESSAIDQSNWEEEDIININMSDGSVIKVYIDGKDITIIDEIKAKAWIFSLTSGSNVNRMPLMKITGEDIVEELHKAFNSLNSAKALITNMLSDWKEAIEKEITRLENQLFNIQNKFESELLESARLGRKAEAVERQIQAMESQLQKGISKDFPEETASFKRKLEQLKVDRQQWLSRAELHNRQANRLKSKIAKLEGSKILKLAIIGELMDFWDIVTGIGQICNIIQYGIRDITAWNKFINIILPCEDDYSKALDIKKRAESSRNRHGRGYTGATALTIISTGLSGYCAFNKAAKFVMKTIGGLVAEFIKNTANRIFNEVKNESRISFNKLNSERTNLKCNKNCGDPGMPPCPIPPIGDGGNGGSSDSGGGGNGSGGGGNGSGAPNDDVQIDPSGFVYEAVPTNRVEGVQASIYYKETKEDMYGDPYEEIVLWNAEEYAQKNPLFTDENGMYQWDVPQGMWQVKFEKDGYVTTHSEWLPVPPPQLDVNIGIVQNKQPEVTEARAYEEGVEVQFDKFMDLSTLTTDNIYVTANGEKLKGEIRFVDSSLADEYANEEDLNAVRYASRVRFVPEESLSVNTGEIRVTVSRNVLSYAGIPMTETFSQVLDIEKEVQAIVADDVKVLYGGEKEVIISALPYEAAVGRTLHIATSSDLITSIDITEATIDEEGKAIVIVKGDLPGHTQLTFSIDDVTVTGECEVDVVTEFITAEAPKASRASGTVVYSGTKIELTTESKDGIIYFTTDGSCPCDENGTRRKYTVPIVINEDTKILAMTSVGTGADDVSETVEFNYTIKHSDMDFQLAEGWTWISHNFENAIVPSDLSADESISRILSQTKEVIRDPELGMIGTLTELSAAESYKVQTTAATARKRLSDIAWNPTTPLTLATGWNWLSYPVNQTMTVDEALATTKVETLDIVVGQNGFAQFDGEKWIGTLETMSPGMGYMYQSQSPKKVIYNTSIVSSAAAMHVPGISEKLPLVLDIHKYESIMPVIATLMATDGSTLDNEDYQVAAFCETECRGIGRVVNGLVMMNIYGKAGDEIIFQITDVDGETTFGNDTSLIFSETVVGDIFNPYVITINNQSGINSVKYEGNIRISIEGDMLRITGITADDIDFVDIYSLDGQKLLHKTKVSESGIRISTLTTGVYVVIVNGNGEYTYHKIAVR